MAQKALEENIIKCSGNVMVKKNEKQSFKFRRQNGEKKNGSADEWKNKVFHKQVQKVNKLGKYLQHMLLMWH